MSVVLEGSTSILQVCQVSLCVQQRQQVVGKQCTAASRRAQHGHRRSEGCVGAVKGMEEGCMLADLLTQRVSQMQQFKRHLLLSCRKPQHKQPVRAV